MRTRQLHGGFWIDEGLSVGIAHHHWSSIPGFCRQDGSPPGYYLLLGLWIRLFGDSERATHTLSLIFAARVHSTRVRSRPRLFDRSTGFVCAVLAAFDPYLTYYAQETRMYSVEAFLSLLVALAYVNGILRARTLWTVAFVLSLVAMLYVHNWALFLCVGLAVATVLFARERLGLFARRGSRRRCALRAVAADAALAGAAHGSAVVDGSELPRSRPRSGRGVQRRRAADGVRARRRCRPARARRARRG